MKLTVNLVLGLNRAVLAKDWSSPKRWDSTPRLRSKF